MSESGFIDWSVRKPQTVDRLRIRDTTLILLFRGRIDLTSRETHRLEAATYAVCPSGLNTIARFLPGSESSLISLFEYINRLRVRAVIDLLKHQDVGVLEAAIDSGYNNLSYFNRTFKRITGLTPTDYMKQTTSSITREDRQ